MNSIYLFEWAFTPIDYFEEKIEVVRDECRLTISEGRAEAEVTETIYDANPSIGNVIHDGLNNRFLGAQLISFLPYDLFGPRKTRIHPDGRRDIFVELKGTALVITGGTVDIEIKNDKGTVVYDSKRVRIESKKSLADLVAKYRATDTTLTSILNSYNAAVRDPQNELIHLYEIRDAITKHFGNKARNLLGITTLQWSRLGQLCNDEPLRQGRHRGGAGVFLRDATEEELREARNISRAMIELYLTYLDSQAKQ